MDAFTQQKLEARSVEVAEGAWRDYQTARGSADHTDREAFVEVVSRTLLRLGIKTARATAESFVDAPLRPEDAPEPNPYFSPQGMKGR